MTKQSKVVYFIPYAFWLLLFVVAPLVLIVYQSFFTVEGQFTLSNYQAYFQSGTYLRMTLN